MNGLRIAEDSSAFPNEMRGYIEDCDYLLVIHGDIEIDPPYGWLGNPKVQKWLEPLKDGIYQWI
jgi:hypothetical protein